MPRPDVNTSRTFGMPSTRAATLFFIMIFLLSQYKSSLQTKLIFLSIVLFCCFLKWYMKEHSFIQLLMGSYVGSLIAFCLLKL